MLLHREPSILSVEIPISPGFSNPRNCKSWQMDLCQVGLPWPMKPRSELFVIGAAAMLFFHPVNALHGYNRCMEIWLKKELNFLPFAILAIISLLYNIHSIRHPLDLNHSAICERCLSVQFTKLDPLNFKQTHDCLPVFSPSAVSPCCVR